MDGLDAPGIIKISPDGKHLYLIADGEDDSVSWFDRNVLTGEISYLGSLKDGQGGVDGLNGAYGLAISSDGKHVYATGKADHAVSWFERNETSGALTYLSMHRDGVNGVDGLYNARTVELTPDGKFAYVAASSDDAISMFERNASSCLLYTSPSPRDQRGSRMPSSA